MWNNILLRNPCACACTCACAGKKFFGRIQVTESRFHQIKKRKVLTTEVFYKKRLFLTVLKYSPENTCVGVPF